MYPIRRFVKFIGIYFFLVIIYSLLPERIINLVLGGFGSIILIYGASIDFISIDGNYSKL